jgi:two-component system response regulator YesN
MYSVLIVDDDALIRDGIASLIDWDALDIGMLKASGGAEAIGLMKCNAVDILITDVCMPEITGLELIGWAKHHSPDTRCIVISSYSDFGYVKQAACLGIENYILKPVDDKELRDTVSATIEKIEYEQHRRKREEEGQGILQDNILMQLAKGDLDDFSLRDKASFIGFNLNLKLYMVVAMITENNNQSSHELLSLLKSLHMPHEAGVPFIFCDTDGNCNLVYGGDQLNAAEVSNGLKQIVSYVNDKLSIGVYASCSPVLHGYASIPDCYAEARRLLSYSLILGRNTVISYDYVNECIVIPNQKLKIDHYRIKNGVASSNAQGLISYADELIAGLSDISSIHAAITEFVFSLVTGIKALNYDTYEFMSDSRGLFANLFDQHDKSEASVWIQHCINGCFSIVRKENANNNKLAERLKSYVSSHFSEDINLKTIAYDLGMNAYYLGSVFKDHTGLAFKNYLNEYRIERAKELLLASPINAVEVAEKVGYVNTNYFYTLFKKVAGLSPSAFRERHAKQLL